MSPVGEGQTRLTEPGQEQPLRQVALGFEKYPNFAVFCRHNFENPY